MKVVPIMLAGGFGTRLAPLSSVDKPKQFLSLLVDGSSFFQQTIRRLRFVFRHEKLTIVINRIHKEIVIKQLIEIGEHNVKLIVEPESHNTFAPVLLGLVSNTSADLLFVTPTDLHIENYKKFASDLQKACFYTYLHSQHAIFGIKPTYASNEYGYIKTHKIDRRQINDVLNFTEKPSKEVAEKFLTEGSYLWNSGMFLFSVNLLSQEVEKYQQRSFESAKTIIFTREKNKHGFEILYPSDEEFLQIKKTSIDYAIAEKSQNMCCISANFDWMDTGSWKSIAVLQWRKRVQIDRKIVETFNISL